MKTKRKKIVVIGGGTGTFTVLTGIKKYQVDLTAIVSMADDGFSTGILRDELGVLPPGDVRQCLVALSTSDMLMRKLMGYRFDNGALKGHSFGNLLLSALEKTTGSFDSAVEKAGEILRIHGRVIPVTLDKVRLVARVGARTIRGENNIQHTDLNGSLKKLWLEPAGRANPKALAALRAADAIIIGPGNLYSSLVPDLLVRGISKEIRKSRAKKIFIANLMTQPQHTYDFTVADYTAEIEKYLGCRVDVVVYNNKMPPKTLLKKYAHKGETPTLWSDLPKGRKLVGANFISHKPSPRQKGDIWNRSLIRHEPARLASVLARELRLTR